MRKFLLLISMLVGAASLYAQTPAVSITTVKDNQSVNCTTYDPSTQTPGQLKNDDDQTWTAKGFNFNNGSWGHIRCGWKTKATVATVTTDFTIDAAIETVDIKIARIKAGDNDILNAITLYVADDADMTNAANYSFDITGFTDLAVNGEATFTATVAAPAANKYYRISFDVEQASNNGFLALNEIDYYGEMEAGTVAAPTISMADDNMVVISHADESAAIYYTTNDDAPTASSTRYTAPFAISAKTTVKAIAVANGKSSAVATKVVNLNTVEDFAALVALNNVADQILVKSPFTVIYVNGEYIYTIDDNDNYMLLYQGTNDELKTSTNGDKFSWVKGVYSPYQGLSEFKPSQLGDKSQGTAVEPEEIDIEELALDQLNRYVVLKGVSIAAGSNARTFTMTDQAGESVTLYNTFNSSIEVSLGDNFTVTGFVSCYNTTLQITPISIEGGTVKETVATPVIAPESGSLLAGDLITITCETEGAEIYFTTEDETPSTDSQLYTGPISFTEAITIRAIAVKDGMFDSAVATASYTLAVEGEETATFDFTNIGSLNPSYDDSATSEESGIKADGTTGNNYYEINGVAFTNNGVSLVCYDTESTKTSTRLYIRSSDQQLRIYKGSELSITAPNRCELLSVEMESTNKTFMPLKEEIGSTTTATSTLTWLPGNASVEHIDFAIPADGSNVQINKVTVKYLSNKSAGIDLIESDNNADAPVEYFNLQGIRVAADNLTPGIYVRRQGNEVSKILVK